MSIDFAFSGTRSKDTSRLTGYQGLHGETSWILISDHFTRHITGDTRRSKASPIHWLQNFLETRSPDCKDKYVCMDQGGELYQNRVEILVDPPLVYTKSFQVSVARISAFESFYLFLTVMQS